MLFAAGMPRLFATHPSLEERLKALDPAFRTAELPALAAAAARDAQRFRQADVAQAAAPPGSPAAPGAGMHSAPLAALASDAAVIAAQAGTIATEQVRYAEQARTAIRKVCASSSTRRPRARAHPALLASRNPQCSPRNVRFSKTPMGRSSPHVLAQRGIAGSLAPELRLPVAQQLFPSLRRLTLSERQKLRDVVGRLALSDRIDVFECCLTLLLASSLYDELETGAQHGSGSLLQEADAVHVLFCVLAAQGTSTRRWRRAPRGRHLRGCRSTGRHSATSTAGPWRSGTRWRAWCICGRSRRRCSSRAWCAVSHTTARSRSRRANCCAPCARYCIARCRLSLVRQGWARPAAPVVSFSEHGTGAARRRGSRWRGSRARADVSAAGGARRARAPRLMRCPQLLRAASNSVSASRRSARFDSFMTIPLREDASGA